MTVKWENSFDPRMKLFTSYNTRNSFIPKGSYVITGPDFKRVTQQVCFFENCYRTSFDNVNIVKKKLSEAFLVSPLEIPSNIVTMNSIVSIKVLNTGKLLSLKLVFPEFENYGEQKLSLFSALGAAIFLGKIGDKITYSTWKSDNLIRILDIVFQPEANGKYFEKY